MPDSQTHIIRRQVIEVNLTGGESEAMQWQAQVSRFAREVLPQTLAAVFDKMAPPDRVLRFEKLELQVELTNGLDNWEEGLKKALAGQLEEALLAASPPGEAGGGLVGEGNDNFRPAGIKSVLESVIEHFFHFLETGSLPWQATSALRQHFEAAVLQALASETIAVLPGVKFRQLMTRPEVRQRLLWQFSEKANREFIRRFYPDQWLEWLENERFIQKIAAGKSAVLGSMKAVLLAAFFENPEADKPLLECAIHRFLTENPVWSEEMETVVKKADPVLWETIAEQPKPGGSQREQQPDSASQRPKLPLTESIFIENAGLVLLHPFLPAFLEGLGVAKAGKITQPGQAVHLLQYLATGHQRSAEYLLPLNKILCGLPLDEPVPVGIRLTKKIKAEAHNLLEAVIRHWSALKNTSPEGLQGTFLCREGQLTRTGNGWLLRVESKAFDILMEQLPWGLSIVRLPWMEDMLWVEWQ